MLNIKRFTGGFTETNGYLIEAPEGCILIDAPEGVTDWLDSESLEVTDLLLTHLHFDHVMDAAKVGERGARIYSYATLSKDLTLETEFGEIFDGAFAVDEFRSNELLEGVDTLEVAGVDFQLIHVPGHSPDSIGFYSAEHRQFFGGDILMAGGFGRTDFPHGDEALLFKGIREKVFLLDGDTVVHSGHGEDTTVGAEKIHGPVALA